MWVKPVRNAGRFEFALDFPEVLFRFAFVEGPFGNRFTAGNACEIDCSKVPISAGDPYCILFNPFQGFLTRSRSSLIMRRYHGRTKGFLWTVAHVYSWSWSCFRDGTSDVQPHPVIPAPVSINEGQSWIDSPLEDLQGKGNFSIRSFAGKPVNPAGCIGCVPVLCHPGRRGDWRDRTARRSAGREYHVCCP